MKNRFWLAAVATTLGALLSGVSVANAATCSIGGLNFTLNVSSGASCQAGNDLGNNGIEANDLPFFSLTGWEVGDSTDAGAGDGDVMFASAPAVNTASGNWSLQSYGGFSALMIVLKSSTYYAAFLLDESLSGLTGTWSITENRCNKNGCRVGPKDLSHASVYHTGPSAVPVPAAGLMLLGGLGGLAALRRKRRAA